MDPSQFPPPPSAPEPPQVPGAPPEPQPAPPAEPAPPAPPAPRPEIPAPPAPMVPPPVAPTVSAPQTPPMTAPQAPAPVTPGVQYAPPPPPDAGTPAYAAQAAQPPKKKSKTLVIVLVILGVLLLCCIGSVVLGWGFIATTAEEVTGSLEDAGIDVATPDTGSTDTGSSDTSGGRSEWTGFQPQLDDASIYAEPTAQQTAIIAEVHEKLYPDFVIEDTVAEPGTEDRPDMLFVKASLVRDPEVRIAYYMWTDSVASTAADKHLTEDQTETYETLAQASDGTYYIYDHENLEDVMSGTLDSDLISVLKQAEVDFPGYVAIIAGDDNDNIGVVLTRWDVFPDLNKGLAVTFAPDGSGWTVQDVTDW